MIDGESRSARSRFAAIDPSTGESWTDLPEAQADDVDDAVRSAERAFVGWRRSRLASRQQVLAAIADRIEDNGSLWAHLLPTENGRPVREVRIADVPASASIFRYFAGIVRDFRGHQIPVEDPHSLVYTAREPLGVIAALIPWNSPIITLSNKLAPALATGNTVVVKPSEYASASVLEFVKLIADLVPPGVINVVTGNGPEVGAALVSHSGIAKITLTGGPETARQVMAAASLNLTPSLMELGGKGAMIVCPDADLERAVADAATGIFLANGQSCIASSRLLLHSTIRSEFIERFVALANAIVVGDALDPLTEMGPLISKAHRDRVLAHLGQARADGVQVLCGGGPVADLPIQNAGGFFVSPTLLADEAGRAKVCRQEIFGPVVVAETFTTYEDAVARANDTKYGLAAGIWTCDLVRAHRLAEDLDAGIIWVNKWFDLPAGVPMGGIKESGFGRELSSETLLEYSAAKSVNLDLGAPRYPLWGLSGSEARQ